MTRGKRGWGSVRRFPSGRYQARYLDPELLLPCNVVVRSTDDQTTVVEALDPHTMVDLTANPDLGPVADDASSRLAAALDSLTGGATEKECEEE